MLLAALALALAACNRPRPAAPDLSAAALQQQAEDNRGSSLKPPARKAGPARPETPKKVEATRKESAQLVKGLLGAGIPAREVASVADTRGYKYFHWRYFKRARIWFEHAVRVDPTFEMSLYNAARCAAATGDHKAAVAHLKTLEKLDTPMSRSRLVLANEDPDIAAMVKKLEGAKK